MIERPEYVLRKLFAVEGPSAAVIPPELAPLEESKTIHSFWDKLKAGGLLFNLNSAKQ